MKTVKLSLEETLKYRREIVIEVPDSMTEKELEQLLNETTRKSEQSADVPYDIKKINPEVVITEFPDSDLDSPDRMEVEINDWEIVKIVND